MTPYETLNVGRDATPEEIKRAYRDLSKDHHPDQGGDETRMKEITAAYAILKDPEKRRFYDETGKADRPTIDAEIMVEFDRMSTELFFKQEGLNIAENLKLFEQQIDRTYQSETANIARQRKLLDAAKARIITAPENDLLGGIIAQRSASLDAAEKNFNHRTEVVRKALEILKSYVFNEPEKPPVVVQNGTFFVSMNGTNFS